MFTVILDIFSSMKNWKKALLLSFISYMVILFGIVLGIVFIMKGFSRNLPVLAGISIAYMSLLFLAMTTANIIFKKRLTEE